MFTAALFIMVKKNCISHPKPANQQTRVNLPELSVSSDRNRTQTGLRGFKNSVTCKVQCHEPKKPLQVQLDPESEMLQQDLVSPASHTVFLCCGPIPGGFSRQLGTARGRSSLQPPCVGPPGSHAPLWANHRGQGDPGLLLTRPTICAQLQPIAALLELRVGNCSLQWGTSAEQVGTTGIALSKKGWTNNDTGMYLVSGMSCEAKWPSPHHDTERDTYLFVPQFAHLQSKNPKVPWL